MVSKNISYNLPQAFISIKRGDTNNRLKVYESKKIFLEKDSEFQIEFENYTNSVYLAKIKMNGKFISDTGLILKPGQHVYLDRYLDVNRRFKFDVYEIDDTPESKAATSNNGYVEIFFYKEKQVSQPSITWTYNDYYEKYDTTYPKANFFYFSTSTNENYMSPMRLDRNIKTKETGRVEQGSISDQSFKYENREFESYYSVSTTYQLLPLSEINSNNVNVREYCTNCGYRLRDNKWTFCPKCGNRV